VNNCGNKVFIIAEAGVNHNGSLGLAKELVDIAAESGADAVKFQTFKAEKMISRYAPKAMYQIKTTGEMESQLEMVKKLEFSSGQFLELAEYCSAKGIEFMSSPFNLESVDFLAEELQVVRIKIGSGEITNAPLLYKAAKTGRPVILSTGMSTLGEIEMALGVLAFGYIDKGERKPSIEAFKQAYISDQGQKALQERVTLLHCTTEYPAPFEEVNLKVLETLRQAFGLKVGYSDHTLGISIPIAAVALGAEVIEKHFTLDKNLSGPDHKASLEPEELKAMVSSIRQVEQALGSGKKIPTVSEINTMIAARKSLTALKEIRQGEEYTEDNLGCKRPGNGLSPLYYWELLGRKASRDYKADEMVEL